MPAKTKAGRHNAAVKAWATRNKKVKLLQRKRRAAALKAWKTRRAA